jgi:predicted enzyme related to lactoylglutathione lyase
MRTGTRKAGEICWVNMLTPRPAEARAFFGDLLGWTYVEMPSLGHTAQVGGRDICGLFDVQGPHASPGTPPHIGILVKVDGADATCEKVKTLGGEARHAFDIAEEGRIARCTDPNGADFVVWEPRKFLGTDVDSSHHGAPSWFETMTTDIDRAAEFYSRLFGWTQVSAPGFGSSRIAFKRGTDYVAGVAQISSPVANMQPHWAIYFTVKEADQSSRQAVRLGATLCTPVQNSPGGGHFCGITSPQGVTFYVIEYPH